MKKQHKIGAVVVAVLIVGISFLAGKAYGQSHALPSGLTRGTFSANGQFGMPGDMAGMPTGQAGGKTGLTMRGGMGATTGKIVSLSGQNLSVQMANGSTQLVLLSDSTQISKSIAGSATDLGTGTNVIITGKNNSDGSITAEMVQIR